MGTESVVWKKEGVDRTHNHKVPKERARPIDVSIDIKKKEKRTRTILPV
jgi:hypothetical protein